MGFLKTAIAALALMVAGQAAAAEKASLCVYDPSGANGDVFNLMKDYRTAAVGFGVEFELVPFKSEKDAADGLTSGKCQAALITGVRSRSLHKFGGTIEAMGALPDYKMLKKAISGFLDPRAASMMKSGAYELGGIFPGGAVNLFIKDRAVAKVEDLKGKKIAVMAFDPAAKVMIAQIGAVAVPADLDTFANMFNSGKVDLAYAPAYAYKALELSKGVGSKGGILRYPLAQLTLQLVFKADALPADFGAKSRAYALSKYDDALSLAKKAETQIPGGIYVDIPKEDVVKYDQMLLDIRLRLRDSEKLYDKAALKMLARIRCGADKARPECALKKE